MAATPDSIWRNPVHFIAFGFGSGAAPKAPGTAGSLVAVAPYLPLSALPVAVYGLVLLGSFGLGIWLCGKTAADIKVHDHGGIVWDEFVGMWLTLFMAPQGWLWIVVGFCLFRIFDIVKPWPIKWVDKQIKGGLGIMLDDVLAGIMAALCIQAAVMLIG